MGLSEDIDQIKNFIRGLINVLKEVLILSSDMMGVVADNSNLIIKVIPIAITIFVVLNVLKNHI